MLVRQPDMSELCVFLARWAYPVQPNEGWASAWHGRRIYALWSILHVLLNALLHWLAVTLPSRRQLRQYRSSASRHSVFLRRSDRYFDSLCFASNIMEAFAVEVEAPTSKHRSEGTAGLLRQMHGECLVTVGMLVVREIVCVSPLVLYRLLVRSFCRTRSTPGRLIRIHGSGLLVS